jgi:hypothetical protein
MQLQLLINLDGDVAAEIDLLEHFDVVISVFSQIEPKYVIDIYCMKLFFVNSQVQTDYH